MTEAWEQWVGYTVDQQYALRQYLGGSGHSAVFLTEYRDPEPRKAVIKLVPVSREKAAVQLSRAESAARLSHPHLLQVFQVGLCQLGQMSLIYLVMEYADDDLSQVIPQRALSASEALDMLGPALEVLTYLHGQGFVHGHLKPSNILAVDDRVKLSGDLLCRIGDTEAVLSPAEDVRALAMTLVEVLTQRRDWPVSLPAPFHEIVPRCLQQNPRRRWTVDDISKRVNPPATSPPQTQKQWERKWLIYAVPLLAVLVVAILAGSRLLRPRIEQSPPVTSEIAPPTKVAPALASFRPAEPVKTSKPPPLPAGVVHRVLPAVPGRASSTIHGKLKMNLEVSVDPSGSVLDAKLNPPILSRYFGDLALQAARDWKFAPSRVDGLDVPSKWILRFEFERSDTKVYPERIAP